jgi:type 1 glutamine amidotransferase
VASLYRPGPLAADAQILLLGHIPGQPLEPVAWTRLYGDRRARIFYTSLGHESDFADSEFRRLLVNAVAWGLEGE